MAQELDPDDAVPGENTSFRFTYEHTKSRIKRITETQLKLWRCIFIMTAVILALVPAYCVCIGFLVQLYSELQIANKEIERLKLLANQTELSL